MVSRQLYYTISGEELFVFKKQKMPYLCGLWRFANAYILANDREEYCSFPICKLGYEPTFPADDSVSGNGLLVSLCNLAKQIDNWNNEIPYDQLIIRWYKENMHPYSMNFVYQKFTEEGFDITGYDTELTVHDDILSINKFMNDLEKLYTTALFDKALEDIYVAANGAS